MTEPRSIGVREAMRSLGEGRLVYALDPSGKLAQVESIKPLLEHGLRTPAYTVQFTSGHVRVSQGEVFRVA